MTLAEIAEDHDIDTVEEFIKDSAYLFGLDTYPLFNESYRDILNEKIIRRYWNREIAFETVEMFRFRMFAKMHEIMVYYNQLYDSTKIKFDPMSTMDIQTDAGTKTSTVGEGTADSTTSSTGSKDSTHAEEGNNNSTNAADTGSRSVSSTTPQNQLSRNGDYADSMVDNNTESSNTSNAHNTGEGSETSTSQDDGTSSGNTTSKGEQVGKTDSRTHGYQAVSSDLLRKYRDTFLNIDMMVLDNLAGMFMAITSTGDEYFYEEMSYMQGMGFLGTYY